MRLIFTHIQGVKKITERTLTHSDQEAQIIMDVLDELLSDDLDTVPPDPDRLFAIAPNGIDVRFGKGVISRATALSVRDALLYAGSIEREPEHKLSIAYGPSLN
ncbi:hypothetical protein [Microvirga tunisiensis]|uniref:Uncharacterized protein n=1 Tax=Microvirga tunisiensis TaxID=2108360 RepID=A0A5N7MB13_9HYPH|nr:hypothetical protein [Microvirga tunisiensis]MPR06326.1 hypothetical protein [Microvirga tunisiensis]MPR24112.1 hypothetical protein [Microvirga tunisiensis]